MQLCCYAYNMYMLVNFFYVHVNFVGNTNLEMYPTQLLLNIGVALPWHACSLRKATPIFCNLLG